MRVLRSPFGLRPVGRLTLVFGLLLLLAIGAFVGSALTPGGSGKQTFAVMRLGPKTGYNPLAGRIHKVVDSNVGAKRYGEEVAMQEDQGMNLRGELIGDLTPLPAQRFVAPENHYRAYAQQWIDHTVSAAKRLEGALRAGDRGAAKLAWEGAWSDYLRLGAVYGLFGNLDQAIDGTPGGLPGGAASPRFTGLHRIEMGLWTGQPLASLLPYDQRLQRDLVRLGGVVPSVKITPLEYATRSHEIIEDAQRDFLSGLDVPWSKQGVLGTAAAVAATEEVFHTLHSLLADRDNTQGEVRDELAMLRGELAAIRRRHGGRYPSLAEMSIEERTRLNGYVAGALTALQDMPPSLETEELKPIPKIAKGR